ncbi:MAG: AIPR family protein, partial [Synergistaceae bacterium]|nr:AIPR family protein [Synergistaceae bacterium]
DIPDLNQFSVSIYSGEDIERRLDELHTEIAVVPEYTIEIDKARNFLAYETEHARGIVINIKSDSLTRMFNKFQAKGLFDMNIRRYVGNRLIDDKIKETLDENRDDFWFLNNGIVIVCENYVITDRKIELSNFSIVNGGQTTYLIGKYKGSNLEKFYIQCKIISEKETQTEIPFSTRIAEATNSQKPILPRDLKSNSPEMLRLVNMLRNNGIYLDVKRGAKKPAKKKLSYSIKNVELAQIVLSMVMQTPGIAKSGAKRIFESQSIYNSVFKVDYERDADKKAFLIDLVKLYSIYTDIVDGMKKEGLNPDQADIIKNGTLAIFAVMGVVYRLANNDITEADIRKDINIVRSKNFVYGGFIHKLDDDFNKKLRNIINSIVISLTDAYRAAYKEHTVTSAGSYFKSDTHYMNIILRKFIDNLSFSTFQTEVKSNMDIFMRLNYRHV